ncbi:ATP-binding protein [Streptomyces sp. NPDC058045]|uniref:ATP-binding protein n=1 Tax=Streptomyces sp. NPDC058045 TaxID=3346311 RepID=UPI0036E7A6A0
MAIDIAADPALVARVRHDVCGALRAWGLDELADDMALMASELVGNAVRYAASGGVGVLLKVQGSFVLLEVTDADDQGPTVRQATAVDENGRGVFLVDALAETWGYRPKTGGGKVVWVRLSVPVRVRPGIWCELHAADGGGSWLVGSFDAGSVQSAEGWIRVSAYAYLSALGPLRPSDLDDWLAVIERDATGALAGGRGYECQIEYADTTAMWSARPVRFLPLAGRSAGQLPPCAEMFPPFTPSRPGSGGTT